MSEISKDKELFEKLDVTATHDPYKPGHNPHVALNDEERKDLQTIQSKNIPLVIQYVPTDNEESFKA